VLLRPPGEVLPHRGQCEPHDLSQHAVLRTKLETHVIMKSHKNVICLQYHSLPLCRRSGLGALGTSRRGSGQVAMAGWQTRTSPASAPSVGTTEGTLPRRRIT
jgi:hypothetical protein